MFLWYNNDDMWYNFSDWVVAESVQQCNEIIAHRFNMPLVEILGRNYSWNIEEEVYSDISPYYVEYSKSRPILPEKRGWSSEGF